MKLSEIAARLGCRLEGDGNVDVRRMAAIDRAEPGDLTFLANAKYRKTLETTRASAVIVTDDESFPGKPPFAVMRSRQPYLTFAEALRLFVTPTMPPPGVDQLASVARDAAIGSHASIGPFVAIGSGATLGDRVVIFPNVVIGAGARIGDDCVIHAGVSIRDRVAIGNRVTILDGAVLGSDGFGFVRQPDGSHLKIPQLADVVVEDDVEIGANTTIDRPAVGETRIQAGTKIDNLVQIAHGVRIGRRSLLASQVGIAGSTVIEDDVTLAGQVGVNGHIHIGKGAIASGKTGVTRNVDAGAFISGYPGMPNLEWRKAQVLVRHLPDLKKQVDDLERRLAELQEKLSACVKEQDQ
ncbi:MAG TPA: UDP-3-O-(3-hydroxymyristoyl)glucosamine N-acyltransferase [Vicinamibacterales bacterium]